MEIVNSESDPVLPIEVRRDIRASFRSGRTDVMRQVALIEIGLLKHLTEEDIAEDLNMTREQFVVFKRNNRPKIEMFKEDIRSSKYTLMQSINERMNIANAFTHASLNGDKETAVTLEKTLKVLEKILPIHQLQTIGQILERIDDVPKDDASSTKIQINVNSPAAEAQRKLEEIRKAKPVDV